MKKAQAILPLCAAMLLLSGCAAMLPRNEAVKQNASVVEYLYPDAREAPHMQEEMALLHPPVRVGIAFAPGIASSGSFPEAERMKLLGRVKDAFAGQNAIGSIEVIPTAYLQPRGGFANLEQVARTFNVEVVVLLSYDQVQFNDTDSLAVAHWTLIGAYFLHGDKYDVQTLVDASVFDVASHKLLFRAPGTDRTKGSASMAGFSESARMGRSGGFDRAVDDLIPHLQAELATFRERIKGDSSIQVQHRAD